MTLEEEKRMVAKWMGLDYVVRRPLHKSYDCKFLQKNGIVVHIFDKWSPQSDRRCWDEIWERIVEEELIDKYFHNLKLNERYGDDWGVHTATPEQCWHALIKTLEEK